MHKFVGIDIGSTASKTVVINESKVLNAFTVPTGWNGNPLPISSMCAVFAESEVIGHIDAGKAREDIAAGKTSVELMEGGS